MVQRLTTADADFEIRFRAFLEAKREVSRDVEAAVRAILDAVCERGDEALHDYTRKFDRFDPAELPLRVPAEEIEAAFAA
ncbi:MAG: histidinol dehydrogenase, partial [Hyphomicrobiaceae bacterium]|nr:histidinol dehydrogenase [Hyphomicrobiaceae bacterium]